MNCVDPQCHVNGARPKRVILLVEDDLLVRILIAEYLREADFAVIEAESAQDAIAIVASCVEVNLVFTDIDLPGTMNGQMLGHWLAAFQPKIPVLLTSGGRPIHKSDNRRFIAKPYLLSELEKLIREILNDPPGTPTP